ncbi:MAG TPA: LiaF domain-containing protein [candidate division Zixibacteria bacterium]
MVIKKALFLILTGTITLGMLSSQVHAKEHATTTETRKIESSGEKEVKVKIDLGAAVIDLQKNNSGSILDAEMEYDPKQIKVQADYHKFNDKGKLLLESDTKNNGPDLDLEDNYWKLEFGDQVPLCFDIDVGACQADFDFTGLTIDDLQMDVGASSVEMEFRKPNSHRISEINLDVGASKLIVNGLGNANFEELIFDGGAGDFTLDFTGDFNHSADVYIDIGLGSLSILVPKDAGIQIKKESSFLASFSLDENEFEEVEDDLYQNKNFGKTKKELIFNIEVGLGTVKVEYADESL